MLDQPPKPAPPRPPTVNRMLRYTLDGHDVHRVDALRRDGVTLNQHHVGQEVAALVVATHDGSTVNLQLFLDGARQLWVTSVRQSASGDPEPGFWHWPKIAP